MGEFKNESRAKILGLNVAEMFKFDVAKLAAWRTESATSIQEADPAE